MCAVESWIIFLLWIICLEAECSQLHVMLRPVPDDSGSPFTLHRPLQLQCDIEAEPALDVASAGWLFNDEPFYLANTHRYTLYSVPARGAAMHVRTVLTVHAVGREELGLYTCEARNAAGMHRQASVELTLVGRFSINIADVKYLTPATSTLTISMLTMNGSQTMNTSNAETGDVTATSVTSSRGNIACPTDFPTYTFTYPLALFIMKIV